MDATGASPPSGPGRDPVAPAPGPPATNPIDRLNRRVGHLAGWLTLAMVVIGAANTLGRYFGRFAGLTLSSNALIELQWYLFSLVFLLAAADTLRRDRHVRVDVLYGRLGARGRAWIDLVGALAFLLPFAVFMLVTAWPSVAASWRVREGSPDPGGLPRYPLKAIVLVAFVLLFLQGAVEATRSWRRLRRRDADDSPAATEPYA